MLLKSRQMEPTMHGYGCVFTRKTLTSDRRKFPRRAYQSSHHLRHQPPPKLHIHRLMKTLAIQLARQLATQIRGRGLGMTTPKTVGGLPAPKNPKTVGMAGSITKSRRSSKRTHALCAKAQARSLTLSSHLRLSRTMLMYGRIFFMLVVATILRWPTSLHSHRVLPRAILRA